ncbi:MAG: hypothetical protein ACI36Y_08740 [Coriobacteriales bacterium]
MDKLRSEYEAVVDRVRGIVRSEDEWEGRYKEYAAKLRAVEGQLRDGLRQFNVPAPFMLYLPLSTALSCSSRSAKYELRFHGQSVAAVRVAANPMGGEERVQIKTKPVKAVRDALAACGRADDAEFLEGLNAGGQWIGWHSGDAVRMRRVYKELDAILSGSRGGVALKGQPEHGMESWLLKNYSQKSSEGKEVPNIQPVKIPGTPACFQMPTPLRASKAKDGAGAIEYSKQYGGGIDILARMGTGRGTKLAVMELKDAFEPSEPPAKALKQAIAYATFIRELLRSDSGAEWWGIFGFGSDSVPESLDIRAVVVMPNDVAIERDMAGGTGGIHADPGMVGPLALEGGGHRDAITLGYIYRAEGPLPQRTWLG